eukprot:gnl/TRDRNA2_/TRDRNA2_125961_c0_seq1.p1 gnl/TRDRNA2_/TRDRNA2_125961_c0~~gnl/TRDRNA2_/TRDRNA2_125961_c0_seq1.p1  ORF type:complete len:541 (-),score=80.59 gnl/TRDRNA2_/TRDRNA2_125961_c0_seq1:43-1665(-)
MPGSANVARLRVVEHLLLAAMILRTAVRLRRRPGGLSGAVLDFLLQGARSIPQLRAVIQGEIDKEVAKLETKLLGDGDPEALMELPVRGIAASEVVAAARHMREKETGFYVDGKQWGGIYHATRAEASTLEKLQADVWALYNSTNTLYPGVFPSIRKFEAEIVAMCVDLLHGRHQRHGAEPDAVGLLTSGGTESILIAVHAYREQGRARGIERPEIVCCYTAHGALDKACHYFGVRLVKLRPNSQTQQLEAARVRAAIGPNTVAIYSSAPTFPHGVVDPIEELAALALEKDVGLHVDNCLGGFYLSFLQRQGLFSKTWDFALPGVTTISMDVHKYGFASKGVSVLAFRDADLRRLSYYPVLDGMTLYITPTLQGARSGATVAAAWATMVYIGTEGYSNSFAALYETEERFKTAVRETPGVSLLCESDLSVIPIVSNDPAIDIYALATELEKRGWSTFTARDPPCMGVCVGERHGELLESWVTDLKEGIAYLRAHPGTRPQGDAAVYGAATVLPPRVLQEVLRSYIDVKMTVKEFQQTSRL